MRSLGGWLILLAVAAGMFYVYYVLQLSGSEIGEYPLEINGGVHDQQIGPVELSPEMNPLRATFHTEVRMRRSGRGDLRYEFAVRDPSGNVVWQEDGRTRLSESDSSKRTRAKHFSSGRFNVEQADDYDLEVSVRSSRTDLREASLELRRNAAGYSMPVLAGIGGAGLLGLILALVGRKKSD